MEVISAVAMFLLYATAVGLLVWFLLWLCFWVPADMAEERGRSKVFWVVFGLCTTPLTSIFLLWLLGHVDEKA